KLCHDCGHKYKELRLSEREWVCEHCGRKHDRDANAALNIRDEALRLNQTGQ
ncbi:zinc ribbon domain-containing protein, partial [uncultured Bifidobacterium sp.]|uniref:zinc ribbon domain-containing protein n=1 Tax=uncultured Bifidobacterium sp. TaxID=165187 RepID=UPI00258BACA9